MNFFRVGLATGVASIAVLSSSAIAGEVVRYEATPDWVEAAELDLDEALEGPSEVRLDYQYRIKGGQVQEYRDRIVRVDNLQALTSEGTLQLIWSPDKGDLFIHALEIIRGDEVIDLVADGVELEVLRREQGLERRLLDGRLTATVAVPGLEEGDMLRLVHSVTVDDQALGDEVQALQFLPQEPTRIGFGRVIMSWPSEEQVYYAADRLPSLPDTESRDGFEYLTLTLPVEELDEVPRDAPTAYRQTAVLRAGTFDSWTHMSRVMEPHFTKAAEIDADSALMAEVERIKAASNDPLKRAELATRLVQDQVSYLLNGLDGGNYLPQDAGETWRLRYGDCKAKSVLLHALLQELDIESEVVLAKIRGGDAVSSQLPLPASFDHMIVRAEIDGVSYWLDGTSTATRIGNMDAVPAFYYALPLRPEGSELLPMPDRKTKNPMMALSVLVDHSAGIDLPALYTQTITMRGPAAEQIRATLDENDPEQLKRFKRNRMGGGAHNQVTSVNLAYDPDTATGTVTLEGVSFSIFEEQEGKLKLDFNSDQAANRFRPNRLKRDWREIPVATRPNPQFRMDFAVKLPDDGAGYQFIGDQEFAGDYANVFVSRTSSLEDGTANFSLTRYGLSGEIKPEDIAAERRKALRIAKDELKLESGTNNTRRWELELDELEKRTSRAREAYDLAVADADDDEFGPLESRAMFLQSIFDYKGALADLNVLIDEEPNARRVGSRAIILEALGRYDEAAADAETAFGLSSNVQDAFYQAYLLAYGGKPQEALDLLDLVPVSDEETSDWVMARAIAQGLTGETDDALLMLQERVFEKPDEYNILNSQCWFSGLNAVALQEALSVCTRAIERASQPQAALDSRALVHYRMGDYDAALADLDAALKLQPSQAGSLFMRGIVMQAQGKKGGSKYIEQALRLQPRLATRFASYGIEPAK